MPAPAVAPPESHVETACPLDCPDACTLNITLRGGRVTTIDGSASNEITRGYICAKVRRFHHRVYGDDRLLHPAVRKGPKGSGKFSVVSWDDALDLIAAKMLEAREQFGAESVLPLCYGGSNGLLTQDSTDATLFRRLGASRLLRTVCAAPTGAANQGLYGKMASVSYQDYPDARLIVLWGVNPATSGIHLMPFLKDARDRGAKIVVDRSARDDAGAAGRPVPAGSAGHRSRRRAGDSSPSVRRRLRRTRRSWTRTRPAPIGCAKKRRRGRSSAPRRRAVCRSTACRTFADLYAQASPALVKCGWGLERNRNGGSAAAAVLALPAVGGKFGVRGGGYSMSNSASWNITRTWVTDAEPPTRAINMNHLGRALTEPEGTPVKVLFVYNCNPAVTMPDQRRVLKGLEREDLFTVVFDQVLTDSALYADVVLPATTFLEHYDFVKGYGPLTLQLARPVIDQVGESRANAEVFADLTRRLGLARDGEPEGELDALLQILGELPAPHGDELRDAGTATPPFDGRPVQFVDVFPQTADRKVHLFPDALDREAPLGLYGFQPDPATETYPLALISPASDRTISSTLGELPRPGDSRRDASRRCRPRAASRMATPSGCSTISARCTCRCSVTPLVRRGHRVACRRACGGATSPTS